MEATELEHLTRENLSGWEGAAVLPGGVMDRGGSGRRFFRVGQGREAGSSLVAMHYSLARRENARFSAITDYLADLGVPAPRILASREDLQVLWIEDLGKQDLASRAGADWDSVRAPLYRAALRAVLPLHQVAEGSPEAKAAPELEPPFDAALYRWEQDYFFEQFAARFSALPAEEQGRVRESGELAALAEGLGAEPRGLLHRDFQSTNVMVRERRVWLIDYQGLRWGLGEYDLASLLYDPYVALEPGQREELARHYHGLRAAGGREEPWESFRARLDRCAAQRLMQALGAYGFLGVAQGQREFLRHIPAAVERLREVAVARGAAPALAPVLSLKETGVA